jgi:hypothetical protein
MSGDVKVWAQRKAALDQVIDETIEWAETDLGALGDSFEDGQLRACLEALRALRHFGDAAFGFFDHGFRFGYLKRSKAYSYRYVLRTILDQMSVDLNLLQKAIFQRRRVGQGETPERTAQAKTLALADRLAFHALKPAVEQGVMRKGSVVTHLAKQFDIRVVPFYDIVLIGIPYTTFSDDGAPTPDFLAILHEVGHYLFERGRVPGTDSYIDVFLRRALLDGNGGWGLAEDDWRVRWLEELFADAYGSFVAGPVNVLSLQERLKDNRPSTLWQDTGEHPIPVLRPLIQTRILRRITDDLGEPLYTEAPERLDQEWLRWIGDPDLLAQVYHLRGMDTQISGQAILQALDGIIDLMLDTLSRQDIREVIHAIFQVSEDDDPTLKPAFAPWTEDLQAGEDPSQLTRQFAEKKYPVEGKPQGAQAEADSVVKRFQERLTKFSARSRTVDELITFVLFEDWETEFDELAVLKGGGVEKPQGPGLDM